MTYLPFTSEGAWLSVRISQGSQPTSADAGALPPEDLDGTRPTRMPHLRLTSPRIGASVYIAWDGLGWVGTDWDGGDGWGWV